MQISGVVVWISLFAALISAFKNRQTTFHLRKGTPHYQRAEGTH